MITKSKLNWRRIKHIKFFNSIKNVNEHILINNIQDPKIGVYIDLTTNLIKIEFLDGKEQIITYSSLANVCWFKLDEADEI